MTPKEKAQELFDKYNKTVNTITNTPIKQCALIAVDEMINQFEQLELFVIALHWSQVKREINNL